MYVIYDEVKNAFMAPSGSFTPNIEEALRFFVESSAESKTSRFVNTVVIPVVVDGDSVEVA
jgi:hypothetical protein